MQPAPANDPRDQSAILLTRFQQSSQWQRALDVATELLREDPDNPLWHRAAGQSLLHLDRLEEAGSALEQALRLDANDDLTHYYLGHLLRLQNRPDEAEKSIRRALELDPNDADYWTELGWLSFERHDFAAAKRCASKSRHFAPDCARAATLAAAADSQLSDGTRDDPRAQVKALEQALELDPENDAAYHNIGVVYFNELRDYPTAERYFRRALALDPTEKLYRKNLTRSLRRQDRVLKVLHAPWRLVMEVMEWMAWSWRRRWPLWFAIPLAPFAFAGSMIILLFWVVFLWPPAAFYEYLTLSELRRATGELPKFSTSRTRAPHTWPRLARFALFVAGFSTLWLALVGAWRALAFRKGLAYFLLSLLLVWLGICLYAYLREFLSWRNRRRRKREIDLLEG